MVAWLFNFPLNNVVLMIQHYFVYFVSADKSCINFVFIRRWKYTILFSFQWMKIDDLFEQERNVRYALSNRMGVLGLMLHQTVDHNPLYPIIVPDMDWRHDCKPCWIMLWKLLLKALSIWHFYHLWSKRKSHNRQKWQKSKLIKLVNQEKNISKKHINCGALFHLWGIFFSVFWPNEITMILWNWQFFLFSSDLKEIMKD